MDNEIFYRSELIKILAEVQDIPSGRPGTGDDPLKAIYSEVKHLESLAYLRGKKDGLKTFKEFLDEPV